jgi:hypothetical protein
MVAKASRARRRARAATGAERQAAYRRRHLDDIDTLDSARLNMIVPTATKRALERLAVRYAVTHRAMLVRLVEDAERAATSDLSSSELRRYYGATG